MIRRVDCPIHGWTAACEATGECRICSGVTPRMDDVYRIMERYGKKRWTIAELGAEMGISRSSVQRLLWGLLRAHLVERRRDGPGGRSWAWSVAAVRVSRCKVLQNTENYI